MIKLGFTLLFGTLSAIALGAPAWPSDWISHRAPMVDTRSRLPRHQPRESFVEINEIPFKSEVPATGALLMIPGFFQNDQSFDLMPEKDVSIARHLMQKYGLKIYLLHVRGLGQAAHGKRLTLDDLAIDDIPAGIRWVAEREKSRIYVFGHSQGGITLQASLSGLDRCGEGNDCFKASSASARQADVIGVALSGANVAMTSDDPRSSLLQLGKIGKPLQREIGMLDRVYVRDLARAKVFKGLARTKPWEFLYHRANVSAEAQVALLQRTIEGSWAGVILQYIDGINQRGLSAINRLGAGARYAEALSAIQVPVVSVTYGLDPMAEPNRTEIDDFDKIGSSCKKFYVIPGQGHEDFMMKQAYELDWDAPMTWLLNPDRARICPN